MPLKRHHWLIFSSLATLGLILWFKLSYPQLTSVDLKIDRAQALGIAKDFLKERGEEPSRLQSAVAFTFDSQTDQFLQKTIGFKGLKKFIKDTRFDMFFWLVRFFKEGQEEEYRLTISCSLGEVTAFHHTIEETAARPNVEKEEAKKRVIEFLQQRFGFNPDNYEIKGDLRSILDHRTNYAFSWQHKDINIPWHSSIKSKQGETDGTGKLVIGATISGDEILSFSKNTFLVPEQFYRDLAIMGNVSANIATVIKYFYYLLFVAAVFIIIVRKNHLVMHSTKKFYIGVVAFSFILSLLDLPNGTQDILFDFHTTSPFKDFLLRLMATAILGAFISALTIIIPSLSGELLHFEVFPKKRENTFLHYIHSTFFSRRVAGLIILGYLISIILLGIQSLLINLGQKYLGVWTEISWLTSFSTSYLPFLVAFTVGFKASFNEELMFRLFTISLGKKIFKNTLLAVILSSSIWGFAHSGYPVYPMWFRGIEVSCLGIFLSVIFLNFGIIPVIVAHFLCDVFWMTAGYLSGQSNPFYFYSSLGVLLLPLFLALCAFLVNKKKALKTLTWHLNKHQLFNLAVLKQYLKLNPKILENKSTADLKQEIARHGWDIAIVEIALDEKAADP